MAERFADCALPARWHRIL